MMINEMEKQKITPTEVRLIVKDIKGMYFLSDSLQLFVIHSSRFDMCNCSPRSIESESASASASAAVSVEIMYTCMLKMFT